jgi:hypothetical protein
MRREPFRFLDKAPIIIAYSSNYDMRICSINDSIFELLMPRSPGRPFSALPERQMVIYGFPWREVEEEIGKEEDNGRE